MRIGIDARFYGPTRTGPGRYTQKLVDYLQEIDDENEYVVFLRKDNWNEFQPKNNHFRKVLADYRWYSLTEQLFLPWKIKKEKVDLMHFPHFNIPIFYPGKFIVTIHDLIITHFPTRRATKLGPLLYKAKQIGYKIVIWLAAKKAKRIITVSQFSKQEIVKHFKLKDEKVVVTYEACDPPKQVGGTFTNIAERFKITKPYLLYVGNTYPHKNLERLVYAFRKLRNEEKIDVQLVLVGKRDYFSERLEILVNEQGMKRDVIFPGFVKDEELPLFYRSALLYVFPSSIEGFGLPPLEAMSYDLPVVSSNAPCMPEILGEAAKYFHPDEISDIVQVVKQVIQDKQMRENLREKGREHIKKFSWRKMVEKTHSIYVRELF
ncbi:glycosyltransferase family 4 protein [Patescibacteria group bacterium]|nr:glycosyltransferase family 4 protein [Patescibacteria group bacterium]MBU1075123.1 glycosyltransferase family 4 protein [Patescibacteria group bacterium]MBU1952354.1 glycosyltransferase family 4 protein [Patescibacteria group bacterium]